MINYDGIDSLELDKKEETKKVYMRIANNLFSRFERDTGVPMQENPTGFIEWLTRVSSKWQYSTFRLNKAALKYSFEQDNATGMAAQLKNINFDKAKQERFGPPSKRKDVPFDMVLAICQAAIQSSSKYGVFLGNFLLANVHIGLRPIEYKDARLEGDKLIVQNAKHNKLRGRTGIREVDLSKLKPKIIQAVRNTLVQRDKLIAENIDKFFDKDKTYNNILNSSVNLLRRIQSKLYADEKPIALYSTRHQSVSNFKSQGYSAKQIAKIMGHSSERIASIHYAKKKTGYGINYTINAEDIGTLELDMQEDMQEVEKNQ